MSASTGWGSGCSGAGGGGTIPIRLVSSVAGTVGCATPVADRLAAVHVEADTRYRVWVVDDGPSENSAFHIVGTIFDTVFKEGRYLLRPDAARGGS